MDLPVYQSKRGILKERKQLLMVLNALGKQRQMLRNQLHALDQYLFTIAVARQALQQTLDTIELQIQQLEKELSEIRDEEYKQVFELITSVIGIGPKTADLLITETNGFKDFDCHKKLLKFIGVIPYQHDSGSSVRIRGRITKHGTSRIRGSLYMGANSAIKHNQVCKTLYQRLRANGKPHKKVMVAVMHKLLRQAFAVVKSGIPFDNQYHEKNQKA
ncbi:MAG: transposase [Saprospiraceae bacterium]